MSISVHTLNVHIGDARSKMFNIELSGSKFTMTNFTLSERILDHARLSFDLVKAPEESIADTQFQVCADIIGKEVELFLTTDSIEGNLKGFIVLNQNADIKFKGFVKDASAYRSSAARYTIRVECLSWDGVLEDAPDNYSWIDRKLNDVVSEDIADIFDKVEAKVDSAFDDNGEKLHYCVKWNETTWGFLQRLAVRHGEWLFNDGEHLYFGKMPEKDSVKLSYPSRDIPSYGVHLETKHLKFSQVGSADYNGLAELDGDEFIDTAHCEQADDKLDDSFNALNDAAFNASKENFQKLTMESVVGSGLKWELNGTPDHLRQQQVPQAHGLKSSMLTYQGRTACSRLSVGVKLVVADNYITDAASNSKSDVMQDEILITSVIHTFSSDETYENSFGGLSSNTKFPPYTNPAAVPRALPTRAIVFENIDPEKMGRVRVVFAPQKEYCELAGADSRELMTPWIRVEQRYAHAGGIGMYVIPERACEVMVDFEGGNAEMPYVRSCLYNGNQDAWAGYPIKDPTWGGRENPSLVPDPEWSTKKKYENEVKAFRTAGGHTIEFHDHTENDEVSDKGFIKIYSHWKPHYEILLSADSNLIKLTSVGNIQLEAGKDIIMHAKNDIKMTADKNFSANAKEEEMSLVADAKSIEIYANQNLNLYACKGDTNVTTHSGKYKRTTHWEDEVEVVEGYHQTVTKNGYIGLIAKQGEMSLESKQKLYIESDMDVKVKAKNDIKISATNETTMKGKIKVTIDGATINMGSTTTTLMDLKAFGTCNISAMTVNFN